MADDAYSPPSIDPADEDSLTGTLRFVLDKFLQGLDDCLPAVVIAYDRAKNRATVRPQIMMGTTGGEKVTRAQIAEVPVLNIGGGGFVLSFPIKPGDLGWIKATDRDVSLYLQGLAEDLPNTKRKHSFQDGLFIPDVMRQWTLNADDAERVVLQSTDGATRIAIGAGTVDITAPDRVTIDAPEVTMTGNLQVDGTIHADGTVTSDVDVIAGTISGKTHTHTSGGPGSPTSPPLP
jgi:hypothetical protein